MVDTGGGSGIAGPPESRGSTDDREKYAYDGNGNRAKLMKRDGRVLGYAYDLLNRVTVKTVPDACVIAAPGCVNVPGTATRDVHYAYDLRGLQLAARFDSGEAAQSSLSGMTVKPFNGTTTTRRAAGRTPDTVRVVRFPAGS